MTHYVRCWCPAAGGMLLLAASLTLACGPASGAADVSQSDVLAQVTSGNGPLILDVRTPEEFATGHVPGAVNIPNEVLGNRLDEVIDRCGQAVVVYCERGRRAAQAAAALTAAGCSTVQHLAGDMAGWRDAHLPVAK